jgi:hypothetical protein
MEQSSHEEVDVALLQWFNQTRAEGTPVSGPMCSQKAKVFHEALGLEGEFNASVGWLTRFKQRYCIHEIAVQGERLSANNAAADMFRVNFRNFYRKRT